MGFCLPGKHVWVERINSEGAVEERCANCGKTR